MKAMFVTTPTVDCQNHVRAWNSFTRRAEHFVFQAEAIRNCWQIVEKAEALQPRVIFYIGPFQGRAVPLPGTFKQLRRIAPVVNLVSDAADKPWHKTLRYYETQGCFDLQVSIDGARDAPVDFATLTPVDPTPFGGQEKNIRCGFSGNVGGKRASIIDALEWFGGLTVRREPGSYEDHAAFMSRCQIVLNTSFTGTGQADHIKGRVLEAAWANACLLEPASSPIGDWFPDDCFVTYRDPPDAARLIKALPDAAVAHTANRLTEEVMTRFTPQKIYTEILALVGHPEPVAA